MEPAPFTYDHFRFILSAALENGYHFTGFGELPDARTGERRLCLLRHDCDNDLVAAAQLARIEADLDVRSTYFVMLRSALYNLMSPLNAALVREILALGHWLGLHFDEHAYTNQPTEMIPELVDRERRWLSEEFGRSVAVVSFHQPTSRVLEGQIKLGCVSTYDPTDMAGFHYLSDSNLNFAQGCPSRLFRQRSHQHVQMLLHPEWWDDVPGSILEKWNRMLARNFDLMQQSLLAREHTYTDPQQIRFDRAER